MINFSPRERRADLLEHHAYIQGAPSRPHHLPRHGDVRVKAQAVDQADRIHRGGDQQGVQVIACAPTLAAGEGVAGGQRFKLISRAECGLEGAAWIGKGWA